MKGKIIAISSVHVFTVSCVDGFNSSVSILHQVQYAGARGLSNLLQAGQRCKREPT